MPRIQLNNVKDLKWKVDASLKLVAQPTPTNDVKDLRTSLLAISQGNPKWAAKAILHFLMDKTTPDQIKSGVLTISHHDKEYNDVKHLQKHCDLETHLIPICVSQGLKYISELLKISLEWAEISICLFLWAFCKKCNSKNWILIKQTYKVETTGQVESCNAIIKSKHATPRAIQANLTAIIACF